MRCCVVRSSTLGKYNRWDPGFFLGGTKECKEEVRKAQARLEETTRRLRKAEKDLAAEQERMRAMVAKGEIHIIGDPE